MAFQREAVLEKTIDAFRRYYNITREDVTPPFVAEAVFHTNQEQFFLVHSAKLSSAESNEYIFFASEEHVGLSDLHRLDELAWSTGVARANPGPNHRNTDVALIIVSDVIDREAMAEVKKIRHSQSYKFTLHGFSNYRLVAIETSSGTFACNRLGENLKKLVGNILSSLE